MAIFAVKITDGTTTILETFGDVTAKDCIDKWHANERDKVIGYREITQAEADAIRAARKP